MATSIITSHHNLERETTDAIKNGAPHIVYCRTCKAGPMSLDEAADHAKTPVAIPGPKYSLFTLFP